MKIYNVSKDCEIASRGCVADSFMKRFRGLMGKSGLEAGECLLIEPCSSIHTFFMKFPIDAVFIGRDLRVLKVERAISPGRVVAPVRGARSVLEFDSRNEMADRIEEGDILKFSKA